MWKKYRYVQIATNAWECLRMLDHSPSPVVTRGSRCVPSRNARSILAFVPQSVQNSNLKQDRSTQALVSHPASPLTYKLYFVFTRLQSQLCDTLTECSPLYWEHSNGSWFIQIFVNDGLATTASQPCHLYYITPCSKRKVFIWYIC